MNQIYYCKNEDDLKRVMTHIFKETYGYYGIEDALIEAKISRCGYVEDTDIENCMACELEDCMLCRHFNDKNLHNSIYLHDDLINNTYFPCIVSFADTFDKNEKLTICSLSDAKNNTKYGFQYDMW